jgi:hypothetical protein
MTNLAEKGEWLYFDLDTLINIMKEYPECECSAACAVDIFKKKLTFVKNYTH